MKKNKKVALIRRGRGARCKVNWSEITMAVKKRRTTSSSKNKVHDWRLCPVGEHWVTTHPMHIPPSKTHPEGSVSTRRGHCAKNPSGKDQLYPDEIGKISSQQFQNIKKRPCPLNLGFKKNGVAFDDLIAGWTQYWKPFNKYQKELALCEK